MATSEMISSVTATRVEIRMPRMRIATVGTRKTTSKGSCHGLSPLTTLPEGPEVSAAPASRAAMMT